jgi:hypothetical protein
MSVVAVTASTGDRMLVNSSFTNYVIAFIPYDDWPGEYVCVFPDGKVPPEARSTICIGSLNYLRQEDRERVMRLLRDVAISAYVGAQEKYPHIE